jgi:hypothetical protein
MTAPRPDFYTPRDPSLVDAIAYARRLADSILSNNPLTDAVVSRGLIKWLGNYANGGGTGPDKINFLWIGEFLPADTNLPGSPPQRGFSLVRDDSRGGVSAIAMYDPSPSVGGALKQVLFFTSGDGKRLFSESRNGGQQWPEDNVPMGYIGSDATKWFGTNSASPTYGTIAEGPFSVVGNTMDYRVFIATDAGTTADFRLEIQGPGGVFVTGPTHSLLAFTNAVAIGTVDVSAFRGQSAVARWQARVTGGAGLGRASVLWMRNYTV